MKRRFSWITLLVGAIVISLAPAISATEITTGAAGLGVGVKPEFEGSNDYIPTPMPFLIIGLDNHMSVEWVYDKLKANLIPHTMLKAGLVIEYIPERGDVRSNRVDRLGDVDTSVMIGGFIGLEYNNWSASIEAMRDMINGNDGIIARFNGGYKVPISTMWNVSLSAFTTWADDNYMGAYFEIDFADFLRSGLRIYSADSGIKDVGFGVSCSYKPWEHWSFMGITRYTRLLGDAADSPITEDAGDPNQFFGGILIVYNWR